MDAKSGQLEIESMRSGVAPKGELQYLCTQRCTRRCTWCCTKSYTSGCTWAGLVHAIVNA